MEVTEEERKRSEWLLKNTTFDYKEMCFKLKKDANEEEKKQFEKYMKMIEEEKENEKNRWSDF